MTGFKDWETNPKLLKTLIEQLEKWIILKLYKIGRDLVFKKDQYNNKYWLLSWMLLHQVITELLFRFKAATWKPTLGEN